MRFLYSFCVIIGLLFGYSVEAYSNEDSGIYSINDDNEELLGKRLVQKYFPVLVDTVKSIAPHIVDDFFDGWRESDLMLFLKTIEAIGHKSSKVLKGIIGSDVSGVLTNIFGNIELRKRYPESMGYVFVSELVLDRIIMYMDKVTCLDELSIYCNKHDIKNSRHDGMVYRWEDGKLVIYGILESKVDGKYDTKQGEGVLDRWKRLGIFLGGYHIPPDLICIRDRLSHKIIPISSVTETTFKVNTFLSSAKGTSLEANESRGERFLVPFSNVFVVNGNRKSVNPGFFYVIAEKLVDMLPSYYSVLKQNKSYVNGGKYVASSVIYSFFRSFLKALSDKADSVVKSESVYDESLFLYTFVVPFYLKSNVEGYLKKLLSDKQMEHLIYKDDCEKFFSVDF